MAERLLTGLPAETPSFSLLFCSTGVDADGLAAVLLVRCELPFEVFGHHHFEPTPDRLVITGADAARRIVSEINGYPAAAEYARLVGVPLEDLNPMVFAAHPVMHRIGGEFFIRSIQCANPDGSLTFYCAIGGRNP
jgi:hypothetical protein